MNLASRDYQEKRSFIRMKVDAPVCVTLSDGLILDGTCHNLSGGGMLVSVPQILPIGAEVEVALSSNHGHHPMLKAQALVKRTQSAPDEVNQVSEPARKNCKAGLAILEIIDD